MRGRRQLCDLQYVSFETSYDAPRAEYSHTGPRHHRAQLCASHPTLLSEGQFACLVASPQG